MGHEPIAVYPGSFDPIHMGHVAIISRANLLFPRVVVAILENAGKDALFTAAERVEMMREIVADQPAVEVQSFTGLLVNLMREVDATIIIRGMRAVSDFEYEFQMALMNRRLYPDVETVFLTAEEEYTYLSSRLVKEVAGLGGDVTGLVPESVRERLERRLGPADRPVSGDCRSGLRARVRVLVLGPGHPFRGGIAATTSALVQALRDRGHDAVFFAARRQYPRWLYPGGDDRDPAACPPLPGARRCLDPFAPWSWRATRAEAQAAAADAWVVPYWTWAWAGWWAFLLQGHLRPPAVAVVHNPADHQAGTLQRLAARAVLSRCQGLFTHAQALAERLRCDYPGVPVSAHPLAAAVSLPKHAREAARESLGLVPGRRVALFLGLIRPYKGVDLLIQALARLPADGGWQLVVAGEPWGGLGDELSRQVADAGLADRVRLLLGWVPEERVATLLAAADLVVLPYRSGSQSAVAPLALGHGVPVLSTSVGGLPEVVEHDRNGLLVPPGSVEALAEALEGLDEGTLARLAAGARETATRLTWDAYAAALEALVEEVVARSG